MHLADAFIQIDFQCKTFFVSICVPWELKPQHFVLLTQCSTTEPPLLKDGKREQKQGHSTTPTLLFQKKQIQEQQYYK